MLDICLQELEKLKGQVGTLREAKEDTLPRLNHLESRADAHRDGLNAVTVSVSGLKDRIAFLEKQIMALATRCGKDAGDAQQQMNAVMEREKRRDSDDAQLRQDVHGVLGELQQRVATAHKGGCALEERMAAVDSLCHNVLNRVKLMDARQANMQSRIAKLEDHFKPMPAPPTYNPLNGDRAAPVTVDGAAIHGGTYYTKTDVYNRYHAYLGRYGPKEAVAATAKFFNVPRPVIGTILRAYLDI